MKNLFKYTLLLIGCLALSQAQGMNWVRKGLQTVGLSKQESPQAQFNKGIRAANYAAIEQAIKRGAKLDNSCLHVAVQYGDLTMVILLLDAGANPNKVIEVERVETTPLVQALTQGYSEDIKIALIKILLAYGAKVNTAQTELLLKMVDSDTIARMLLDAGLKPDVLEKVIKLLQTKGKEVQAELESKGFIMDAEKVCKVLETAHKYARNKNLVTIGKIAMDRYGSLDPVRDVLKMIKENYLNQKTI